MNCTDLFTDLMDSYGFCSQSLQVWSTQGWQVWRKSSVCIFVALRSDMIYDAVEELAVGGCWSSVRASNIESGATEM